MADKDCQVKARCSYCGSSGACIDWCALCEWEWPPEATVCGACGCPERQHCPADGESQPRPEARGDEPPLPDSPTLVPPGPGKAIVLEDRETGGRALWHPDDAVQPEDAGRRLETTANGTHSRFSPVTPERPSEVAIAALPRRLADVPPSQRAAVAARADAAALAVAIRKDAAGALRRIGAALAATGDPFNGQLAEIADHFRRFLLDPAAKGKLLAAVRAAIKAA